eukprot:Clim_evm125s149 gene=Clim_evmTU125s149
MDQNSGAEDAPSALSRLREQMPVFTPVFSRVYQMDAHRLDDLMSGMLLDQLKALGRSLPAHFASKVETYAAELKMICLACVVGVPLLNFNATFGEELLNLRTVRSATNTRVSLGRRVLLAALLVGSDYVRERVTEYLVQREVHHSNPNGDQVLQTWDRAVAAVRILKFLNMLAFLKNGTYPTLAHRLLSVSLQFKTTTAEKFVSYEYMSREMLWQGFAEFFIFLIPLMKVKSLKGMLFSVFFHTDKINKIADSEESERERGCPICGEAVPTIPVSAVKSGCHHRFCYYCIASNQEEDPSFACPSCSNTVGAVARSMTRKGGKTSLKGTNGA